MLIEEQVRTLMRGLESDRVERTVSVDKIDKFGEAICAFANDLPNHRQPGYLLIGVKDNGEPSGLKADERLLQTFGSLRSDGLILPQPVLSVDTIALSDGAGDIVVVEVQPSDLPPVRYKQNVWIRVGPRRARASEQEERILSERRTGLAKTFDARPCTAASLSDLVPELFELSYVPRAVSREILEENHRDLELKLASLRFYDLDRRCPTHAGILLFGADPRRFIESAYIHFVRFEGVDLDAPATNDQKIAGDLNALVREAHQIMGLYNAQRTLADTELRTRAVRDYPEIALREFINNAVMHRQYEAGGPVRIYWFDDRVEIQSPGGLYGEVTPENFPDRYAYRNPVLAEALKVLGHVEKFGSGVGKAQRALARNGNPAAEFRFDRMFVQVTVRRRP